MFTEMFDAKIAEKMSQNSSMGIDEMLFQQLAPKALGEDWEKYVDDVRVLKPVHYNPIPRRTISHASAIAAAAERFNLSPQLIQAVIDAESAGNAYAVSHKGAKGLMQLMDSTAARYNVKDPFNPEQNIMAGSGYIRDLLDRYEGDLELALAAYNAGPEAVEKYGGVPPYEETQKYVARILSSLGIDQKQKYNET
ncbi:MAG: transglycosylase SLT domain-containing protein [candidate division Zixibacteria bacterium]|nr:transglycosylase SLT domain-containing protein [candidate division Zixibacteria bacterium]